LAPFGDVRFQPEADVQGWRIRPLAFLPRPVDPNDFFVERFPNDQFGFININGIHAHINAEGFQAFITQGNNAFRRFIRFILPDCAGLRGENCLSRAIRKFP
jgi:hypothetical protein